MRGQKLALIASVALSACLLQSGAAWADANGCAAIKGHAIAPAAIGLPSSGAHIDSAEFVPAAGLLPSYCKVLGAVGPIDPAAPPVQFEVNLPDSWNGKALQYGGGGLNGTLVTGLGTTTDSPPGPTPLARGYVTFGTDAGHSQKPAPPAFGLNDEALTNHAYAAYKKTHDVALDLIKAYFGKAPSKVYYYGSSEGGREALIVVQRFPQDYDGAVAIAPLASFMGVQLAKVGEFQSYGGEPLSPAQVGLVQKATLEACDGKDGLKDGVIGDYLACAADFRPRDIQCAPGTAPSDTCLSEKQLAWIQAVRSPYRFKYPLAHGLAAYPAFGIGGESQPGGLAGSLDGKPPMEVGITRFFVMKDGQATAPFDEGAYQARVTQLASLLDATDPNLDKFRARGGKLLIKANGSDYVVSPNLIYAYYQSVQKRYGAATDGFVRLFVNPGVNHFGGGLQADGQAVPDKTDFLTALEAWSERGQAPAGLTAVSYAKAAPFEATASRPLCPFPLHPQYAGAGAPTLAASFVCKK